MVFVDCLPSPVAVCSNVTREFEIPIPPFLGHLSPFVVCLRYSSAWEVRKNLRMNMRTMSDAVIRILLAIDEAGELNAFLVSSHNVLVTVFRQSTQVPKTSKKRHRG